MKAFAVDIKLFLPVCSAGGRLNVERAENTKDGTLGGKRGLGMGVMVGLAARFCFR